MYRVYVLDKTGKQSKVMTETRTTTPCPEAARTAFWGLVNDKTLHGKHYLLLMSKDNRQTNAHWFDRLKNDDEFIYKEEQILI